MTKEAKKTLRHVLGSIQDAIEDMGCAMGEVENEYAGMAPDSEEAHAMQFCQSRKAKELWERLGGAE